MGAESKYMATPSEDGEEGGAPRHAVQRQAGAAAENMPPLRAVFMGTPDFAAVILRRVLESPHVTVLAAYAQPDRPAGRGKKLLKPAVKALAEERGIPIYQPLHFKADADGDAAVAELAALRPDVLLVAAYGLILPQRVLDIPRRMPINVHASLLPKYRGAAPIQRAIMAGDAVTGVTIMRMEAGLDSGPILMQRAVGIGRDQSSADMHEELAQEGAELLVQALERLRAGALGQIPQDATRATHAPKLAKAESLVDISLPAHVLHAHIRGLTPWPGATLTLQRKGSEPLPVRVLPGRPLPEEGGGAQALRPGTIVSVSGDALLVRCGDGLYAFTSLRPAGGKSMDGQAFYNGYLATADDAFFGCAE